MSECRPRGGIGTKTNGIKSCGEIMWVGPSSEATKVPLWNFQRGSIQPYIDYGPAEVGDRTFLRSRGKTGKHSHSPS